jgi:hypothetical protein
MVATMKLTKNLGMLLLAIWLILTGIIPLTHISYLGLDALIMPVLALAAGVCILLQR